MYYDYFGLKQAPFKITPDTSMFFPGGNRGAILDALIYTIMNGEGIIKVVGEVGSGKTMLCRMLEKELPASVEVVYIANPSLSPENILHAIAFDLDLAVQADTSRLEVMNCLQEYLLAKHSAGQHVVIFIEEAQSMPVATLEEIRLLSNLETQQNKLLQIVMFGQPELDTIISQREIRQLKERITYSFQLNPFATGDIRDYLNTRLRACGYRSGELFQTHAVRLIEKYSLGLVRRINILADKAMLAAYAGNTNLVTARHVRQAARDSEFVSNWRFRYGPQAALILSVIILGTGIIWFISGQPDTRQQAVGNRSKTVPGATAGTSMTPADIHQEKEIQNEVNTDQRELDKIPDAIEKSGKLLVNIGGYATTQEPPATLQQQPEAAAIAAKPGNERPDTQAGPVESAAPVSGAVDSHKIIGVMAGIETQLLGLEGMFTPAEMGDKPYTDEEIQLLREQLERYPPEVAFEIKPSPDNDVCHLCWTIIYRPLVKADKL